MLGASLGLGAKDVGEERTVGGKAGGGLNDEFPDALVAVETLYKLAAAGCSADLGVFVRTGFGLYIDNNRRGHEAS